MSRTHTENNCNKCGFRGRCTGLYRTVLRFEPKANINECQFTFRQKHRERVTKTFTFEETERAKKGEEVFKVEYDSIGCAILPFGDE